MKKTILALVWIVVNAASFSKTIEYKGWQLSGGEGKPQQDIETDNAYLTITGDGTNSTYWKKDVTLEPGEHYRFTTRLRMPLGSSEGLGVVGTDFVNQDVPVNQDWLTREFVFRTPGRGSGHFLRLGQWHVQGTVWFEDITLTPVQPVIKAVDGYRLGEGERLGNGFYQAILGFGGTFSNSSRCLYDFNSYFNTYRWDLSSDGYVIYKHVLIDGTPDQLSADISVNIGYYSGGTCVIESSSDAISWQMIGTMNEKGKRTFSVPQELFPIDAVYIRLRCQGIGARIQINGYEYRAVVPAGLPIFRGETRFVDVNQKPGSYDVRIESLGAIKSGERIPAVISVTNRGDRQRDFRVLVESDGETSEKGVTVNPGQTRQVELETSARPAGSARRTFSVRPAESGDSVFEASVDVEIPYIDRSDYGYFIGDHEGVSFWWTDAMRKISRDRPVPTSSGRSSIELCAAGNEHEAAQLVLSTDRDSEIFSVTAGDLVGENGEKISSDHIKFFTVEYVLIDVPSDGSGIVGYWPDPLLPLIGPIQLEKGKNRPLWISVYVPGGTEAGTYSGSIEFVTSTWKYQVPFRLHVWPFSLPKSTHLKSAFGLQPQLINKYHHLETQTDQSMVFQKYLFDFADHRLSPYNPFVHSPITTSIDAEKLEIHLDFEEFDRAASYYLDDLGFSAFRLAVDGLGSGTFHSRRIGRIGPFEQGSPEYDKIMKNYLAQLQDHLKEKGWIDKAYVYWFDEPAEKDYEFVRETNELIRSAAPDLAILLTEQPEPDLYGYVDIWCPLTSKFDEKTADERRAHGEHMWWYVCTTPKEPFCTLFIDHSAGELRTLIWQSWKFGVEGVLVWSTNYWTSSTAFPPPKQQNPYSDPMSYREGYGMKAGEIGYWGNGDGRFIYPPKSAFESTKPCLEGPVGSIRWEMLREGMEDYEYFWLLRELIHNLSTSRGSEMRLEEARTLLQVPDDVCSSLSDYCQTPEPIYRHRERMARAIRELMSPD